MLAPNLLYGINWAVIKFFVPARLRLQQNADLLNWRRDDSIDGTGKRTSKIKLRVCEGVAVVVLKKLALHLVECVKLYRYTETHTYQRSSGSLVERKRALVT